MGEEFEITPYVGVGELRFGMTLEEVRTILGSPVRCVRNRSGGLEEFREGLKVCYSHSTQNVTDFVIFPPSKALYKGLDLLAIRDPISVLLDDDSTPLEGMGIVVFLKLGVTITGSGDTDSSDKTITLFAEGRWDGIKDQLKPLQY